MCKCIYAATVKTFTPTTCHLLALNAHPPPSMASKGNIAPGAICLQLNAVYSQVAAELAVNRSMSESAEIMRSLRISTNSDP